MMGVISVFTKIVFKLPGPTKMKKLWNVIQQSGVVNEFYQKLQQNRP